VGLLCGPGPVEGDGLEIARCQGLDVLHQGRRPHPLTGAAGGLGGFGVELAAMRGLRVIAAAGDGDDKLVCGLGAAEFVPRSAELAAAVRDLVPGGVDVVFDAAVLGYRALDAVRAGVSPCCWSSRSGQMASRVTPRRRVLARAGLAGRAGGCGG
jgi:D-arabinose 1-dehydrogenase-like Zn-dependent alcohol dehydrogenase